MDLRAHVTAKLEAATLERFPFPHLIIEDFFPPEIYAQILEHNLFRDNPGTEWLSTHGKLMQTKTPYEARLQINFHRKEPCKASAVARQFWTGLSAEFLEKNWFVEAVVRKYPDYFALRYGELSAAPDFVSLFRKELFLQRHKPGYFIGPHTDVPPRVFTCIFSFADRPGFEEFGTQMFVHKDRLVRCWGNDHYAPDDFIERKVAPYRPNNFLLFFKTRQSSHGVRTIDETVPNQRYGMQFQFYEPLTGLLKDLSEPTIDRTRSFRDAPAKQTAPA
jgi:hypothetical protein